MSGAIIPIHRRTFVGSLASAALVGPTLAESARFAIRRLAIARHATAYLEPLERKAEINKAIDRWLTNRT
jgi:hypothetical protein